MKTHTFGEGRKQQFFPREIRDMVVDFGRFKAVVQDQVLEHPFLNGNLICL